MDLFFKDLYKKCIEAQQIVYLFIKISAYLTGKGHQRVDSLRVPCEKAGINFKSRRSIFNTRFLTHILVISRILDLMLAIEQLKAIGDNGFDRSTFAKSVANDDVVTYSALKHLLIECDGAYTLQLFFNSIKCLLSSSFIKVSKPKAHQVSTDIFHSIFFNKVPR